MIDYMEQQADEIECIQEELDDCQRRLEDHSNDTELLKSFIKEDTEMRMEIPLIKELKWVNNQCYRVMANNFLHWKHNSLVKFS